MLATEENDQRTTGRRRTFNSVLIGGAAVGAVAAASAVAASPAAASAGFGTPCGNAQGQGVPLGPAASCTHTQTHSNYNFISGYNYSGIATCAGLAGGSSSQQACVGNKAAGQTVEAICTSACKTSKGYYSFVHNHSTSYSGYFFLYISF